MEQGYLVRLQSKLNEGGGAQKTRRSIQSHILNKWEDSQTDGGAYTGRQHANIRIVYFFQNKNVG